MVGGGGGRIRGLLLFMGNVRARPGHGRVAAIGIALNAADRRALGGAVISVVLAGACIDVGDKPQQLSNENNVTADFHPSLFLCNPAKS